MTTVRLVVSILQMLMAACFVGMNWACVIASERNRRRGIEKHQSVVPLVSLILAGLAGIVYPFTPKFWIGFIPLVDIGNWKLLWLPVLLFKWSKDNRKTGGNRGTQH